MKSHVTDLARTYEASKHEAHYAHLTTEEERLIYKPVDLSYVGSQMDL